MSSQFRLEPAEGVTRIFLRRPGVWNRRKIRGVGTTHNVKQHEPESRCRVGGLVSGECEAESYRGVLHEGYPFTRPPLSLRFFVTRCDFRCNFPPRTNQTLFSLSFTALVLLAGALKVDPMMTSVSGEVSFVTTTVVPPCFIFINYSKPTKKNPCGCWWWCVFCSSATSICKHGDVPGAAAAQRGSSD